uniref:3'(2'),5'-bisphosphate nucleotidase n=1 Tax=Corethron hystrix TaxID=216773 RepID=A0A7S1BXF7_9STRA|mmetsp:Transcript_4326/g.8398  ORF Transcript_4326/g.8398 Transcript_4326/m.8398 type:complete len:411 (+) Transcript_4326:314-1546(+)|eukprot:CAMPEP_0113312094 /NCGR_PEP_ID=MMETSP0010_2-20120614/9056_1 /TAXON_ID=216773 ORGANISM="Corethron hystrix, Strain 308" /NCGR_SAMPLE_ID=MMETSP0010_2 /ASSEMBLY_ACC=CAM_ASM_000155 /LENGTH=410 /DNA_ID=CAMNT_0000167839 /DNA_START=307 /DNA_END=1539 /DNA_ORIENTATION=- /assembly_acc=CAM_ASM_000155
MSIVLRYLLLAATASSSADAFGLAPAFARRNTVPRASSSLAASDKPLTELCEITKEACDAVAPMLNELYSQIKIGTGTSDTAAFKSDATFFTIADGIVQHMFIEYLFAGNKFHEIVGEEDDSVVNILETPYTVDDLVVPEEFEELITGTLNNVRLLADRIDGEAYKHMTVFVDPIDGTREFATGKGDKVTILVGYNDEEGIPQAGIIYRPLTEPKFWASGALSEGFKDGVLDTPDEPNPKGVLITDGKVSPFIASTIENSGMNRVASLASGNRVLMLIEGKAGAYIRDTGGFAKWDTSGPQAVLQAHGGVMAKLPEFLEDKSMVSYTHLKSKINTDFCKRSVGLTLSNARDKSMFIPGLDSIVTDVHLVKEYSCLQGLVALAPTKMETFYTNAIHSAMNNIRKESPPMYT